MKKILAVLLGIIIVAGVLFGIAFGVFTYLDTSPVDKNSAVKRFSVEEGENLHTVAQRLKSEDLIRSAKFIVLLSRIDRNDNKIKAGMYDLKPGTSAKEILQIFIEGKQKLIRVTIPEGTTIRGTAEILAGHGIVERDDFIRTAESEDFMQTLNLPGKTAEGFLFPDTYYFPKQFSSRKVIEFMVKNFYRRIKEIYPEYDKLSAKELLRKIIMASIVEREYRVPSDAPKIASVFYNRLSINMGLGSCATVEYIITEIEGKPHPDFLTYDDLQIQSPYNTYLWAGLPPGPICSPGAVSLRASFFPAHTDYWYFVLKDPATGEHYFSKDKREHNKAIRLYLKGTR